MQAFTLLGRAIGKQRPRFAGHAYTPTRTRVFEQALQAAYRQQCGGFRFTDGTPLRLSVLVLMKVPARDKRSLREQKLAGAVLPTKRPDWDNLGKIVSDALNGLAYADDSQISDARVLKRYALLDAVCVVLSADDGILPPDLAVFSSVGDGYSVPPAARAIRPHVP